ncbi:neuraminidase-like domain-containing protein [Serratia sp. AKBS12]|uniref:Tc toxin subunit A-related protein n=1 Tax=Serratia sp. AKBS12 TaxID=2974597 RepID=UPI00216679DC|nr:neuraminidase-like domain-containing protein [Serratia sp. AKBS12]MCS3409314.1 neuraminidase-like domain-containing protein [Serratia sp. AKBS12]
MDRVTSLLQKINLFNGTQNIRNNVTLADLLPLSLGEIKAISNGALTRDEANYLYEAVQEALKENKKDEIAVLSRANPQLKSMVSLGVQPSSEERGYEELLGGRAFSFAKPGSVASMFSPAGYLTELYREAKNLHSATGIDKEYHLDHRRPDLKSLVLNQKNLTGEISTLSLANDIVLKNMMAATSKNNDEAMQLLSTYCKMGENPFHLPHETLRLAILSQDENLSLLTKDPDVGNIFNPAALLAFEYGISPKLYNILTEEITESNASNLVETNFGNIDVTDFVHPVKLAHYYGLSYDELRSLIGLYDGFEFNYKNDTLIYPKNDGLSFVEINRIYGKNTSYSFLEYVNLFPQGDKFVLEVLFNDMPTDIYQLTVGTGGDGSTDLAYISSAEELQNKYYKIPLNLTEEKLISKVTITLGRTWANGKAVFSDVTFKAKNINQDLLLLKLNKAIRLYKVIGMTPEEILDIADATHFADMEINNSTLEQIFYAKHYKERYQIDSDKARVLANRDISLIAEEHQPSPFNRLFNTPLLNGKAFSADGTSLNLNPDATLITQAQAHQLAVIKRAFGVNGIELLALWKMANASESATTMNCSLKNLSALYRLRLLAEVHHLSVEELVFLTRVSPWKTSKVVNQEDETIAERIKFFYRISQWLTERRWTVAMIFLMTTDQYSNTMTPEIQELKQILREGLLTTDYLEKYEGINAEKRAELTSEEEWNTVTSIIAAAVQLDSDEKARLILQWANGIQPDGMNTEAFLSLVRKTENTADEEKKIAQFFQCLAQLSLIINTLMLTEGELSLMLNKPSALDSRATTLQHDIMTLYKIAHFHDKLHQANTHMSEVLTCLREGTLSAEQLARAMDLDPKAVAQALKLVKGKKHLRETEIKCGIEAAHVLEALRNGQISPQQLACALDLDLDIISPSLKKITSDVASVFSGWEEVEEVLQWMEVATMLHITPAGVFALSELHVNDDVVTYSTWVNLAEMMEAGLDNRQVEALQAVLDERISRAVCGWYIKNGAPAFVNDRDTLYSYLLIDNQVSSQVKTTPIAEAIASIQLYINRALNNLESGVDNKVKSRQFFADWDRYNKRYSNWAGVSQLVYYPENYIDPTIRVGQTQMMDNLLGQISQGELTQHTVENAVKNYMTQFEQVASLEVISGYHDNVDPYTGLTYLIGRDTENRRYYWRKLDYSKFNKLSGTFPANAWSEWKSIDMGVNPINDWIRPVIWQGKLWAIWVERKELTEPDDASVKIKLGETVSEISVREMSLKKRFVYELKLSHIQLDGTWSQPYTIVLENKLKQFNDTSTTVEEEATGFYCAGILSEERLVVVFHTVQKVIKKIITVYSDLRTKEGEISEGHLKDRLDSECVKKISPSIVLDYKADKKDVGLDSIWGERSYSLLTGGKVTDVKVTEGTDNLSVSFSARIRVVWNGTSGELSQYQMDAIKLISNGKMGGKYIVHDRIKTSFPNKVSVYAVIEYIGVQQNVLYIYSPRFKFARTQHDILIKDESNGTHYKFTGERLTHAPNLLKVNNIPGHVSMRNLTITLSVDLSGIKYSLTVIDAHKIDTELSEQDVKVSIELPGETSDWLLFSADKNAEKPLPIAMFSETIYTFSNLSFTIPKAASTRINVTLVARAGGGVFLGKQTGFFQVLAQADVTEMAIIKETAEGAQYLQTGPCRVRLNTLFARQLTVRANQGINAVLSMETQQLPEPNMGQGNYISVTIPSYDSSIHRDRRISLYFRAGDELKDRLIGCWQGMLGTHIQHVNLFIPLSSTKNGDPIDFPNSSQIGKEKKGVNLVLSYQNSPDVVLLAYISVYDKINGSKKTNPVNLWVSSIAVQASGIDKGFNVALDLLHQAPMDFTGANALYFWEMFFYVPMMIFHRLFRENRFEDAQQWIKYIWDPAGYFSHGEPTHYQWNCRPLEEDTSWNSSPLDSIDPDAVSQSDPMHYKVYVFMCQLDLLIERGDTAYRELQRDSLNEAKMWYTQTSSLLGYEPFLSEGQWHEPALTDAAESTGKRQAALLALRQGRAEGNLFTANSLTALFLPEMNEKLMQYWLTLKQRLYNLRHNLSIDGQPLLLPIFAPPADPKALLTAMAVSSQGGATLPPVFLPLYRFQPMLENAKNLVSQLIQFGSTLLNLIERQDAEKLSELLQTQGNALVLQNIELQQKTIEEVDSEIKALNKSLEGALFRKQHYDALIKNGMSALEITEAVFSGLAQTSVAASIIPRVAGHFANLPPNIYGFAVGGMKFGSPFNAAAALLETGSHGANLVSLATGTAARNERRREEWELQAGSLAIECEQIKQQIQSAELRAVAAEMQKGLLELQQKHHQQQLTFLQNKFSNKALYSWLRGRLATIYRQFYDLTLSRCLMAQATFEYHFNLQDGNFIKPGAWKSSQAGLMSGETLMLSLAQMEEVYLKKDKRVLEITRTVSLAERYKALDEKSFTLDEEVAKQLDAGKGEVGTLEDSLKVKDNSLIASINLKGLNIQDDYPDESLGKIKRIKQISVTLPLLMGPYEDVQAVLRYGGSAKVPQGCNAIAVSHGMNDSGQFQLDFNDARYLPFEGIPVDDMGLLSLSFPNATGKQKVILQSLTDIIFHIRYTIL